MKPEREITSGSDSLSPARIWETAKDGGNVLSNVAPSSLYSLEDNSNDDSFEGLTSFNADRKDVRAYVERRNHKKHAIFTEDSSSTTSGGSLQYKTDGKHAKFRRYKTDDKKKRVASSPKHLSVIENDNERLKRENCIQEGRILELRLMLDKQFKLNGKYKDQRKQLLQCNKTLERRLRKLEREMEKMRLLYSGKHQIQSENEERSLNQDALRNHMSDYMEEVDVLANTIAQFNNLRTEKEAPCTPVVENLPSTQVIEDVGDVSKHQHDKREEKLQKELREMSERVCLLEDSRKILKCENSQLHEEIDPAVFGYQDELAVLETEVTNLQGQLTSSKAKAEDLQYLNGCLMKELDQIKNKENETNVNSDKRQIGDTGAANVLQEAKSGVDAIFIDKEEECNFKSRRILVSHVLCESESKQDHAKIMANESDDPNKFMENCHRLHKPLNDIAKKQGVVYDFKEETNAEPTDKEVKIDVADENNYKIDEQIEHTPLGNNEKKTDDEGSKSNRSLKLEQKGRCEDLPVSTSDEKGSKDSKVSTLNAIMEKVLMNELQQAIEQNLSSKAQKRKRNDKSAKEAISLDGEGVFEHNLKSEELLTCRDENTNQYIEKEETEILQRNGDNGVKECRKSFEGIGDEEEYNFNYDDDVFYDEFDFEGENEDKPNAIVEDIETDSENEETGDELEMTDLNDEADELDKFLQRKNTQKQKSDEKPAGQLRYGKNRSGGYVHFMMPTKAVLDGIKEEDEHLCDTDVSDGINNEEDANMSYIDDILEEIDEILSL